MANEDKITTKTIEVLRPEVNGMSAKMAEEVVCLKNSHHGSAASTVSRSRESGGSAGNFAGRTLLTQTRARKVVRKAGNIGFEAYRQLSLMYGKPDQEGSTGLFVQIMTYKFGSKIEDVEDRLNEFLELVRRYDEANGTDPVPDQVKKACILSNAPDPLKALLQLNVAKLGNFNALRVAEDYLRSRRIFKTTSAGNTHDEDSMEVDAVSQKGTGKEKSGKGKKGGKKGRESHPDKGYGETTTEHSRFEGEC